ncbi:hypothetical protein [Wenxinia marina]|uniref:Transporter n=1 Tax=Wenxinia marina DSM 24838 TaxID=1123501 RepID=A0A0D0Q4K1_9RHOB|nr:hypothetical protein [Wenxinia marina]KIQ67487.1 hypothetical protein Wenmar_03911 [Wenxinia marina DSM 24838]GGL69145.1 hypothetical protein GCM10011392_24480 [Wenxinia marina]
MTYLRALMAAACIALVAGAATAGAWPRDEGEVFVSVGGNFALFNGAVRPVHYDPTIYLEYGLTDRLTLGLDGYLADAGTAGSGFAFIRWPLGRAEGADPVAVSLGFGAVILPDATVEPSGRLGVHWGRALDNGWLAVDAEIVQAFRADRRQTKVEASWGYRFAGGWSSILSAQAGTGLTGDFYAKVMPSVAYEWSEGITLRLGLTQALTGDHGTGLTFQTWITF